VRPETLRVMAALGSTPAFLLGPAFDILALNEAGRLLYSMPARMSKGRAAQRAPVDADRPGPGAVRRRVGAAAERADRHLPAARGRPAARPGRGPPGGRAGVSWVNTHTALSPGFPIAGTKWSGLGIEGGVRGLDGYAAFQTRYIA
jgi:hypothetical protein